MEELQLLIVQSHLAPRGTPHAGRSHRLIDGGAGRKGRLEFLSVRQALGPLWAWLPAGALHHDPHAYLKSGIG